MLQDFLKNRPDATEVRQELAMSLDELRAAAQKLGRVMKRLGDGPIVQDSASDDTLTEIVARGQALIQLAEERLGRIEHQAEESIRNHPRLWLGGALGLIGTGILLSRLMRPQA